MLQLLLLKNLKDNIITAKNLNIVGPKIKEKVDLKARVEVLHQVEVGVKIEGEY